jgi:hypothetical protein
MVDDEESGPAYKVVTQTKVGTAYLAKLPLTTFAQTSFMNFVFDLAKGRRMKWQDVLVQIKIVEEKNKSGANVASLSFSEMEVEKQSHKDAVAEAKRLYSERLEAAKSAYAAKSKGNPAPQTSSEVGTEVPFATGKSY